MSTLNRIINLSLKNNKIISKPYNIYFTNNKYRLSCMITKRNRAIFKYYKLSRLTWKDFVDSGYIMGIRKSTW